MTSSGVTSSAVTSSAIGRISAGRYRGSSAGAGAAGIALGLLALLTHGRWAGAQSSAAELTQRLHLAEGNSSFDLTDTRPWHLKLAVNLFDDKGNPKEAGTLEEWWLAPHRWRAVYSTPSFSAAQVENEEGQFSTKGAGEPPLLLRLLHDQIVHPLPSAEEVGGARLKLRKDAIGKIPLDCILLEPEMKSGSFLPLGMVPTFCFDRDRDSLRTSSNFGFEFAVRNSLGRFQGRWVPLDTTVFQSSLKAASAHVATLSELPAGSDEVIRSEGLEARAAETLKVSGSVMNGQRLSNEAPRYPDDAKRNHRSGTVVLRATITRDGRVQSLQLASVPDADLAIAAMEAVRNWKYKPFLVNGLATEVDTTIVVNFSMR